MKATPELMAEIGPPIKVCYLLAKDPATKEYIDTRMDEHGQFIGCTGMARELGLPTLTDDSSPEQYDDWARALAEAFGVRMPYRITEPGPNGTRTMRLSWEEE